MDVHVSSIAAAIGDPARARMLYGLVDGRARTSTELAVIAGVSPSTASAHLGRLQASRLVTVLAQGKHRYFSLRSEEVATALEALSVLAGGASATVASRTPQHLRAARTCYDHMAGALGVALHERFLALPWLSVDGAHSYRLTAAGRSGFTSLGIDLETVQGARRRFAFPCLDWSERRPHLGGGLAAAFLGVALKRRWVVQDLDSRALRVTRGGQREIETRFGLRDVITS
jgi:DNA-binding transcriptional ArsR family regulator